MGETQTPPAFYRDLAQSPECGTPRGFTPETWRLAENMPAAFVLESIRKLIRKSGPVGKYHSAWAHVEYALCEDADVNDEVKKYNLDQARQLLAVPMMSYEKRTSALLRFQSTILCSYLPIMQKRALMEEITRTDVHELYRSIGASLEMGVADFRSCSNNQLPAQYAEATIEGLAARTGQAQYILYPTSPREESSDLPTTNHDCYGIHYTKEKLPMQIKVIATKKVYDAPIEIVLAEGLTQKISERQVTLSRKGDPHASRLEDYSSLIPLIIKETKGEQLKASERDALNIGTAWVVSQLHKIASTIEQVA